ncbi:MAG: phosphatase [Verrucomicrobiota bacterium]
MQETVAVIDVGSNSIKLLVACRAAEGVLSPLFSETIETRISTGISLENPRLQDTAIRAGAETIAELVNLATSYHPTQLEIVATSAVRDASNGDDFTDAVFAKTGKRLRILSGQEEATSIGRGVACDPALAGAEHFIQVDLGGGSLELVQFSSGQVTEAISLQLGAVRLSERFIDDNEAPIDPATEAQIRATVIQSIQESGFPFPSPDIPFVATGGAFVITRAILAAQQNLTIEEHSAELSLSAITTLKKDLCAKTLHQRMSVPHLPANRTDIIPTALITIEALMHHAERRAVFHSFCNLRFGIAAALLTSN